MLVRWEPFGGVRRRGDMFGDLTDIQQEMNRLFDDFFGERRPGLVEGNWMPSVDLSEDNVNVIVRAELPGMKQEDIELSLQDNALIIKGEKKKETNEETENFHRLERSYGSFSRALTLPVPVDPEKITAAFCNGILEIILPKVEEVKPKKISINAGA